MPCRSGDRDTQDGCARRCRRLRDRDLPPDRIGVTLPVAGIRVGCCRVARVVITPVEHTSRLVDQPRGELRAVPWPGPPRIVLRSPCPQDVSLADVLAGEPE